MGRKKAKTTRFYHQIDAKVKNGNMVMAVMNVPERIQEME